MRRLIDVVSVLSDLNVPFRSYGAKDRFDTCIRSVSTIDKAMDDDLTFCSSDKFPQVIASIEKSNAKVILCSNPLIRLLFTGGKGVSEPLSTKKHKCLVYVNNPSSSFIRIMNECSHMKLVLRI